MENSKPVFPAIPFRRNTVQQCLDADSGLAKCTKYAPFKNDNPEIKMTNCLQNCLLFPFSIWFLPEKQTVQLLDINAFWAVFVENHNKFPAFFSPLFLTEQPVWVALL
ncbi:hypothetical protein AALD01_00900 [Oscillospiraceae bacterium 21-37]